MAGVEQNGKSGGTKINFADQPTVEAQQEEKQALHPKALSWFWALVQRAKASFLNLDLGQADQAGAERTIEAKGSDSNVGINFKFKGNAKAKFTGASYVVTREKVFVISIQGEMLPQYDVEDEFIAVPPTLASAGTPGQKAWDNTFLYYCVAPSTWIKLLPESADLEIDDFYVAVPPLPNSTGRQGQRAYDVDNALVYECVATNTWVRYAVTTAW